MPKKKKGNSKGKKQLPEVYNKLLKVGVYDSTHRKQLQQRARKVQQLYKRAIDKIAKAAEPTLFDADPAKEFHFEDFPALNKAVDEMIDDMGKQLQLNVEDGDSDAWTLANTKNDMVVNTLASVYSLPKETLQAWRHPHLDALQQFEERRKTGMNLSNGGSESDLRKGVWNLDQFKNELELALEQGIGQGKSAADLSRDVRQYLKYPNKLFHRVRDKDGNLRLSKAAAAFHPGRGVYRSSYKNALRLTATENNIAYRTCDHQRWNALPFVIGQEIKTSNNHPVSDICDTLAGKYPVEFKFTGWHPFCRCYSVSLLAKESEMDEYCSKLEAGEDVSQYEFSGKRTEMPETFTNWMKDNEDRIAGAKSMPYFIKDNYQDGDPSKGLRWIGQNKTIKKTVKENGVVKMTDITTPKVATEIKPVDEWKGVSKNNRELMNLIQTDGWTEQNKGRYQALLDKAYEAEMKKANLTPTKLRNKAEEAAVDDFTQWGFEELNEALRAGKPLTAKQQQLQQQIDKIISRTTLKKDMVVYRGTQNAPTDINPAYSSTSTRITIAEHFSSEMYGSKHLYAYRIPKGTHCLIIGGAEDEIVLPRGFNLGECKIGASSQVETKKKSIKELTAERHASRTQEEISSIKKRWEARQIKHQQMKDTASVAMKMVMDMPEVDGIELQKLIKEGDLDKMYDLALKKINEVNEMKKKEQALEDLLPDIHEWHKKHTIEELKKAHDAVKTKLDHWSSAGLTKEELQKKLQFEIDWKDNHPKYVTDDFAKAIYQKKADTVAFEIDVDKKQQQLNNFIAYKTKSKAYKDLLTHAQDEIAKLTEENQATQKPIVEKKLKQLEYKKNSLEAAKSKRNTAKGSVTLGNTTEQKVETAEIYDSGQQEQEIIKLTGCTAKEADDWREAVNGFSFQWDWEIRQYQTGNTRFTSHHGHTLQEVKKKAEDCEKFIKASPKWNGGTTYRGINVDDNTLAKFRDAMANNKEIDMLGTSSWSRYRSKSEGFAQRGTENALLFYTDDPQFGTSIRYLSKFKDEHEILCSKDARWKIKKIKPSSTSGIDYEIWVESIMPKP